MAPVKLVITNGKLKGKAVDIFVAKGLIEAVHPAGKHRPPEGAKVVDAAGLLLLPSLSDVHTHLREPGFEYKEDIASGLAAAAHGGFGNILCMANTLPVNDNATVTELMLEKAGEAWPGGPRLFPIGALTQKLEGKLLAPMAELAEAGCVAFSNDGVPIASSEIMRRAMEYASDTGRVVIDHCEDPHLAVAAGINEGAISSRLGLAGQPDVAEAAQVARDVLLAEYLDLPIHLAHISCEKSVDIIARAKDREVDVTAETCPHYLCLTEDRVTGYDTAAKVNPPLRTEADRQAVLAALESGVIDMLATDHAPHAAHEKEVEFDLAPCGITGLDTALSLTWGLVARGELSEAAFLRAWTKAPAERFLLPVNRFRPGDPADFLIFDPDKSWTVSPETLVSKGKNSPWIGSTLSGRVERHFLSGKKIV